MNVKSMCKIVFASVMAVAGAASAEESGEGLVERETGESAWHFRIGPVMAPRVRVKLHGPRYVRPALPVSGSSESGSSGNAPADPSAGFVKRQYIDGYVGPDEGSDDPGSMIYGLTWDWSANDVGSQYSGGRIDFRTDMTRWVDSYRSTAYSGGSDYQSEQDILLGVEAMGGWTFYDDEKFDVSIDGGFRFYGSGDLSARSKYGTTLTTVREEFRYVDSYDASGWTDVPGGPHTGSPGGPGRVIGAIPHRREELMNSDVSSETYFYHSKTKFEYRIWDIRLGPTFGWYVTDDFKILGGVYGLIGLVDVELRTSSGGGRGAGSAKKSKCDAVFGMAAGISAQYNFTDSLFLSGGAEYDWWSDEVDLSAGGADSRLELSDFTVSLSLGFMF